MNASLSMKKMVSCDTERYFTSVKLQSMPIKTMKFSARRRITIRDATLEYFRLDASEKNYLQ